MLHHYVFRHFIIIELLCYLTLYHYYNVMLLDNLSLLHHNVIRHFIIITSLCYLTLYYYYIIMLLDTLSLLHHYVIRYFIVELEISGFASPNVNLYEARCESLPAKLFAMRAYQLRLFCESFLLFISQFD